MEIKSILIYGGSFNPPLNSHFSIAQEALNQFEDLEKVIFVPVNQTNHHKKTLIENSHRYNMLNLVAKTNERFEISDIDLKFEKSLLTIEILENIQEQNKDKKIWYLLGSDNLKILPFWKRGEDVISKYTIVVKPREDDNIEKIIRENQLLNKYKDNFKILNPSMRNNYSSTYIRQQIQQGKSIRYMLPDEVYEYIQNNRLYK